MVNLSYVFFLILRLKWVNNKMSAKKENCQVPLKVSQSVVYMHKASWIILMKKYYYWDSIYVIIFDALDVHKKLG